MFYCVDKHVWLLHRKIVEIQGNLLIACFLQHQFTDNIKLA